MRLLLSAIARLLLRLVGSLAILACVLVIGTWLHLRGSLPSYSGSITVAGLAGAVDIVRDRNAVPHIFAGSIEDAAFGLGFAHARGPAAPRPLWPKPPSPRSVGSRLATSSHSARATGAITSCAMRSPRSIVNALSPALQTITFTSPR